ncbi:MATE family efflux transporter [Hamadaea tsunoensis]|uniref:MATE family efflux transporter n=1 Tax=Hamadaea tsunoensis TaxID=53368 RepID=UPI000685C421|nr:lipopolysaccharide biosynthesis protein [Hamadaea tsunoensis]
MTTTAVEAPAARTDAVAATARGGLANLLGAGLAGVSGVAVTWLVARGLGPVQAGGFFAATAAFTLVGGVARLGTMTGLVYWPARLRALSTPELIGACLRASLPPVALVGGVLAVLTYLFAPTVTPEYAQPLRALAVFLPVAALTDALLAASRGYRQMRPTVVLDKIVRPAAQVLLIGAVFAGTDATGWWAFAWALPYVPVCAVAGYLVWRQVRSHPSARTSMMVPFWRFTAPRAVANMAQTALQRIDVLLVAALAGLAPAAAYAVAGRFVIVGQLANGAISQATQPRLAEALAVGDLDGARRLYRSATSWLILVAWPLHLTILQFPELYLSFFGAHYRYAAPAVRLLALAMLLATGCGMVDMVLAMGGRTWWNLGNVLAALVTTVAFDLVLIPPYGIVGAAAGLACSVAVNNLLPLAQIMIKMRLHPFGGATFAAASLTLLTFGAVPAALHAYPLVAIGAGAVAYLLAVLALRDRLPLALRATVS